ncbi:DNA-binding protein [bacterium]|nr:DNA-binding protein [bacterium]
MGLYELREGRRFLVRVPRGEELVAHVDDLINEHGIEQGFISGIGAVSEATIGFYDQDTHEYRELDLTGGIEIVSLLGNISQKEGRSHAHLHIGLADHEGRMYGGHLSGARVFLTELVIVEFTGRELERVPDEATGLVCWP